MADSRKKYWIGFDLGGTKMMAIVYDSTFKTLGRLRKKTKAREGSRSVLNRIMLLIDEALESAGVSKTELCGIGIGYPALLDMNKGVALNAPNLGWKNIPIRQAIIKKFKRPVFVINDVDAGLYGEYLFGAARKSRCVVGIFPGTGIGGACIYEGNLVTGRHSSAMEIGHLPIVPNGAMCGCGRRGCLETVAGRLAISSAAAVAAFRGEAPHLSRLAGTDLTNIRSGVLAESMAAGDKQIEQIIMDSAYWLGRGIAMTVDLLAPDRIVLGGGLVEAMPSSYLKAIEDSARNHSMPQLRNSFKFVKARLGDDAVAVGAAAFAMKEVSRGKGK